MTTRLLPPLFLLFALVGPASAIPFTLQFTATQFFPSNAPTDPVTGTIVYDANSLISPINSLISIDLTIDGHTYTLDEVGFSNFTYNNGQYTALIYEGNLDALTPGTDDFVMNFRLDPPEGLYFGYSSSKLSGYYDRFQSRNFTQFSITESQIPEPATLALLGLGLAGLRLTRRRKQ